MDLKQVSISEIDSLLGEIELIDIREHDEFEEIALKNSVNIPMSELLDCPEDYLEEDKEYYILCRAGRRSLIAAMELYDLGYNVVNVKGGISEYTGRNLR